MIRLQTVNKEVEISFSTFPACEEYVKIIDLRAIDNSSFF